MIFLGFVILITTGLVLVSGQSFYCQEADGKFANPSDTNCRSYYECSNYQASGPTQCQSDWKFHPHPSIRRCLLPDSVDCNDPNPFTCPVQNGNVADIKDCKRFYACQDYAPLHRTCPTGEIFNIVDERCETGNSAQCSSGTFQCPEAYGNFPDKTDTTCRNYYKCNNWIATRTVCSSDFKFHPHPSMRRCLLPESVDCNNPNPFICPTPNSNYADPKDCKRFYSCQDSAPILRTCPAGERFYESVGRCDVGDTTNCGQNINFVCPQSNGLYPDTTDLTCRTYYNCTNYQATRTNCQLDYRFHPHPDMYRCLSAESVDCNVAKPFTCPRPNEDFVDPANCGRFYFCSKSAPLHRTCPYGEIFVDSSKRCVTGSVNDCSATADQYACPTPNGNFQNSKDTSCRTYFACTNNVAVKTTCPQDFKFHTHPNARKCVLPDSFDCNDPNPFECPSTNADFRDPYSCHNYISCQNSVPLKRQCPAGQIFVDSMKSCHTPSSTYKCENFVCPQSEGKYEDPNDMTCRNYFECTNWTPKHMLCQNDFKFHPYVTLRKCVLADSVDCKTTQFVCANQNADVPDPKNASRFYSCQNYAPLHRTCPANQTFSSSLKRCQ